MCFELDPVFKTEKFFCYQNSGMYSLNTNFAPKLSATSLTFEIFTSGTFTAVASVSKPTSLALLIKSSTFS